MKRHLLIVTMFLLAGAVVNVGVALGLVAVAAYQARLVRPPDNIWAEVIFNNGFSINTLFCAAFLWTLLCGPSMVMRHYRIRRGLCPKCAYPMGGTELCTECGKPLPGRAKEAT